MTNQTEKLIVHIDEDLEELIPGFMENRIADVKTMNNALTNGDYETIQSLGHSMKGSGGGYGFDGITDIGKSLEMVAAEKNHEEIRKWIAELATYLDCVEIIYE